MACVTLTGVTLHELLTDVKTGDLLWTPSAQRVEQAGITAFTRWLKDTRGLDLGAYNDLWQWSITDIDAFWRAIWDYNDIRSATRQASLLRLRPIMMTALVACLGLLPAALSTGIGSDTQRPFAIVIVAGLVSRLFLGFFINPVLYRTMAREGDVLQV